MRTVLVISRQASFGTALSSVLDPAKFQILVKEAIGDAEFLLVRGAIDVTLLDLELTDARAIRAIEELKSLAPSCPMFVYTSGAQWDWEEDAYLLGVQHVLGKPVRGKLLNTLLQRLFPESLDLKPARALVSQPERPATRMQHEPMRALEALRRFSGVLVHSLDSEALLKQFLLLLREVIGVNRAIIFLRKPTALLSETALSPEDRWLRSACCIGLDHSVLQHFALSLGGGIGGHLHREGRILRSSSHDAQESREISKEFQLLGVNVAIPVLDRQSLIGVAVFDERLTGEPYSNEELAIIFHMLEEVGLAIRNSWLHAQLHANHAMVSDILGTLHTGCLVIGSNLAMLHSNAAATEILLRDRPGKSAIEFSDLPQHLGSLAFATIKNGTAVAPFKYQFEAYPERWFRISILPFVTQGPVKANAALFVLEDVTEQEKAIRLEVETSNLRLVKSMAEHLAHEIGNSLVPISTHQQLLKGSINDPEFQESLSNALAVGVKRISRLANQMVFLARDWTKDSPETVAVADLIVDAFHEANTYHPGKKMAQLAFDKNVPHWKVNGDPKALRHAFSEIMLNALQANPDDPSVSVQLEEAENGPVLKVEVRDAGKGFSSEAATRGLEPFYSTRNVGLGLGLTVTRRIIESHQGSIEIPQGEKGGMVRISLPSQT
jgi:signal transduction histidine kinase/DNA-binding NarL/FixJ family response regulator